MRILAPIVMLAFLPLAAAAQEVGFDYDKTANFAIYKTFTLKVGTPVGDKLIDDRIIEAIEKQLTSKGLKKAANGDLAIVYHIAFDKEKDITSFSSGMAGYGPYGYGWGGGWGSTSVQVRDILVGTLVIDVADVRNNAVVWRGIGTKEVDTKAKPDKRDRNVNNAVKKILKNFPPKQKT